LENQASVQSKVGYKAIYVKGRITWNTKALIGYAIAYPEVEQFKKVGKPSVKINR